MTLITILQWVFDWWIVLIYGLLFLIFVSGYMPIISKRDDDSWTGSMNFARRTLVFLLFMIVLVVPLVVAFVVMLLGGIRAGFTIVSELFWELVYSLYWLPLIVVGAFLIRAVLERGVFTRFSAFFKDLWVHQTADEISDVRKEFGQRQTRNYPAEQYWDEGKGVFFGLGEEKEPVYVPLRIVRETSQQNTGPSGTGKSVAALNQLAQAILRGDNVFAVVAYEDPYLLNGLFTACHLAGRHDDFQFLDLSHERPGKYPPFRGGTLREVRQRLAVAAGLEFRADLAEVYVGEELDILDTLLSYVDDRRGGLPYAGAPVAQLLDFANKNWGSRQPVPKLVTMLRELNHISTYSHGNRRTWRDAGLDIEHAIRENKVVYVQGPPTADNAVTRGMKSFIVEVGQILARLDVEGQRSHHAMILLDELQMMLTLPVAQFVESLRKRRVTFILGYHTPQSLRVIPKGQCDPDYAMETFSTNAQIAFHHRAEGRGAEHFSGLCGTKTITVPYLDQTEVSRMGGETWSGKRSHRTEEVPLFSPNVFTVLPERVAVLRCPERLATIVYSSWPTTRHHYMIERGEKPVPAQAPAPPVDTRPPASRGVPLETSTSASEQMPEAKSKSKVARLRRKAKKRRA